MSKTTKEATKESKHDVKDGHENEAQSPCKKPIGAANLQSKKSRFLAPAKPN